MSDSNPPSDESQIVVDYKRRKKEIEEAEINKRRDAIKTIIEETKQNGRHYNNFIIKEELKKFGFYPSISTISRDLAEIETHNTFLVDLMKFKYSSTVEQCWLQMEEIFGEARSVYDRKWTDNKIIKKYIQGEDGETVTTEEVITQEIPGPKLDALRIMLDVIKSQLKIFNGGVIDTSIALATKNIIKMKERLESLEKENGELKKKTELKNDAL